MSEFKITWTDGASVMSASTNSGFSDVTAAELEGYLDLIQDMRYHDDYFCFFANNDSVKVRADITNNNLLRAIQNCAFAAFKQAGKNDLDFDVIEQFIVASVKLGRARAEE